DAGLAHPVLHQLADAVLDHGRGDAGAQAEAVGEVGDHIVLAAGDVDVERAGLAEGNYAGVDPVDECPEGEEIQSARILADVQPVHRRSRPSAIEGQWLSKKREPSNDNLVVRRETAIGLGGQRVRRRWRGKRSGRYRI